MGYDQGVPHSVSSILKCDCRAGGGTGGGTGGQPMYGAPLLTNHQGAESCTIAAVGPWSRTRVELQHFGPEEGGESNTGQVSRTKTETVD